LEMLTRKELLEKMKITSPTLYRLEKKGLPVMRNGGVVRYDWDDVVDWMKKQGLSK